MLAHDLRAGKNIQDMSIHLQQAEATQIGRRATDILLALDSKLEHGEASIRYGGRAGPLNVAIVLRALLNGLIQRGLMAQRSLANHGPGPFVLMVPDHPRWHIIAPWNIPRFACPYRPLAEAGFVDNRPIEHVPVSFEPPTDFNDTAIDDLWLRVSLVPTPQAVYELAKRINLTEWKQSPIAIGKLGEALSETLPWLAIKGLGFSKFRLPAYAGAVSLPFGAAVQADPWLDKHAGPILREGLAALGLFPEYAVSAIAGVVLQHLSAGLAGLRPLIETLEAELDRTFGKTKRLCTLMTSGVFGPMGTQLISLCRERGIVLVDFEHGTTTGIAESVERRLSTSEVTTCDVLMASSPRAARSFTRAPRNRNEIKVIGLADQTRRIGFRPLQRHLARRRLKLRRSETVVMHVSTLLYGGNMRSAYDSSVEHYVFSTESKLLTDVYGRISKTVLYKPYPTQRYPHSASYRDIFPLAPNIRLIDWADFRYVRSAADIIVTEANSSTIGWCVGAGVPMVHLGSRRVNALLDDELRQQFSDSFFTIDMDNPNWTRALSNLLGRKMRDIQGEWLDKRHAREKLLADGIFGPPGSVGRRAAKMIRSLHD